jgi:hypothetical protein
MQIAVRSLWGSSCRTPFVTRLLYRFPLKRYYVRFAGSNLQSVAETEPGTEVSEYFRVRVVARLRLLYWPKV